MEPQKAFEFVVKCKRCGQALVISDIMRENWSHLSANMVVVTVPCEICTTEREGWREERYGSSSHVREATKVKGE